MIRLRTWFADPSAHPEWQIHAGKRCGDAPMVMPTNGFIGFGWGDSFRPGHRHSGFDIFSPNGVSNITLIVAVYDGYLTREADWKSTVIIRHPDFPVILGDKQIWTYYTHMASKDGSVTFVDSAFPAGTYERFIEAGTLLGHQGTWSGTANVPTGLHLHFSVVKSTLSGGYANEADIDNTYDPAPFLGLIRNEDGLYECSQ